MKQEDKSKNIENNQLLIIKYKEEIISLLKQKLKDLGGILDFVKVIYIENKDNIITSITVKDDIEIENLILNNQKALCLLLNKHGLYKYYSYNTIKNNHEGIYNSKIELIENGLEEILNQLNKN